MFRKAVLALIVTFAGLSAHAFADEYGAIAYSRSTGKTGWSYNYSDLGSAEAVAIANCGASDAFIVTWARNEYCALAVADDGTYGYGYAGSKGEAERIALSHCTSGSPAHIAAWVFAGTDSDDYYYYYYYY